MRLEYETQISPYPIILSIGTLHKPTLREIFNTSSGMSFERFGYYELFLKMSPKTFYTDIKGEEGKEYWNSLTADEQNNISIYDILLIDEQLQNIYIEIFNFFFVETVIFKEGLFILLKNANDELQKENISGVIHADTFDSVLDVIQQVCCIDDKKSNEDLKFKNNIAKKLYDKIQKAQQKQENRKKKDVNLTIPNIISSVSVKHQSLNYSNIWDLTIFQLLDNFNRLQVNAMYDINALRVSVWGDEKKTFNAALWYKNHYETKN